MRAGWFSDQQQAGGRERVSTNGARSSTWPCTTSRFTAVNQASLLIGRDRVTRLDRPGRSGDPLTWMTGRRQVRLLPEEALAVAEQYADRISETFFTHTSAPFTALA